jgi:hypothetical protein
LELQLLPGFTLQASNKFSIIENNGTNSVNGTFANLPEGATVSSGPFRFTISYVGGDGNDVVLTAQQTATLTTVTSSANPSLLNQSVTFTATVTPASSVSLTPTGTVQFQIDGVNAGGPVSLNGGSASFSISNLPAGAHTITTVYSGDGAFLSSSGSLTESVRYAFGGFRPPLSNNTVFGLNRIIPIKWQLTDSNGALITSLSEVTSLQVAPMLTGGGQGTPFNATPVAGTVLRNDGSQYVFNWQTKGLTAGTYEILLTLADGTVRTKVLQISPNGAGGALLVDGTNATATTAGALLGGDIELYVDNSHGDLTADESARIQDAVTAVDAMTEPYGVKVEEVSDLSQADVTLTMDSTSAVGGYADGVLGCTTDAGQITIINGWNFYAGSDATQIGSAQYDFETVVTHELGHALGLGHSTDSTSVMYATLNNGAVNRTLTTADLNVADSDTTGACGLRAAIVPTSALAMPPIPASTNYASQDAFFALQVGPPSALTHGGKFNQPASDAAFAARMENDPANRGLVDSAADMPAIGGNPIFVAASLDVDEDAISGTFLFSDWFQDHRADDAGLSKPAASQPEGEIDFMPYDGVIWLER